MEEHSLLHILVYEDALVQADHHDRLEAINCRIRSLSLAVSKIQKKQLSDFRFRFSSPLVLLAQSIPDLHGVLVYRLNDTDLLVADGGNQDCRSTVLSTVP